MEYVLTAECYQSDLRDASRECLGDYLGDALVEYLGRSARATKGGTLVVDQFRVRSGMNGVRISAAHAAAFHFGYRFAYVGPVSAEVSA